MAQDSDLRQGAILLSNETNHEISEPCRREGNKTRFKVKLEKKMCNMMACGGMELDMRVQMSLNTFPLCF